MEGSNLPPMAEHLPPSSSEEPELRWRSGYVAVILWQVLLIFILMAFQRYFS